MCPVVAIIPQAFGFEFFMGGPCDQPTYQMMQFVGDVLTAAFNLYFTFH